MARTQRIQLELNEAKEDLEETEYEKYLSDSQNILDTLAQDYEDWMNIRLDDEEALLAEAAGNVNHAGAEIKETLQNIAAENGLHLSDYMTQIFSAMRILSNRLGTEPEEQGSADANLENAQTILKKALRILPNNEGYTLEDAQKALRAALKFENENKQNILSGTEQATADKRQKYMDIIGLLPANLTLDDVQTIYKKANNGLPNIDNYSENDPQKALKITLRITQGYETNSSNTSRLRQANVQKYNSSLPATAPGQVKTGQNLIQKTTDQLNPPAAADFFLPPNEQGGMLLKAQHTEHLFGSLNHTTAFTGTPHTIPAAPMASAARITPAVTLTPSSFASYAGIRDIYIELPDVQDYNDFRSRLIKDQTFEKAMCTMVNNAIMGKSTIEKLKYV